MRKLRADARRNRTRLLGSAQVLFKSRGASVSLDDVAKHAKVGIGTLYRHFPTRASLLAAACDDKLSAIATKRRPGPSGKALRDYIEELAHHATMYSGLAASLGVVLESHSPGCNAASEAGRELLERAQRDRAARRDVTFDDLVCMVAAIAQAAAEPRKSRIARLVALFLDGIRPRALADTSARLSRSGRARGVPSGTRGRSASRRAPGVAASGRPQ